MTIFTVLYLVFVIRFGKALRQWNDTIPGRCYHFDHIALPHSSHPLVDELYLAFTALSTFGVLFVGLPFASSPTGKFWTWFEDAREVLGAQDRGATQVSLNLP